jgi:hypothetical protein
MEDDEIIDDDPNPPYFHPRSHSLCSNLLYASTSPNNNIGQSLTAIPPFQQQTLVGIEALDGGGGNGGLFFNEGRTSPSNRHSQKSGIIWSIILWFRLMVNNIPNNGNNNGGGINFARRISRVNKFVAFEIVRRNIFTARPSTTTFAQQLVGEDLSKKGMHQIHPS